MNRRAIISNAHGPAEAAETRGQKRRFAFAEPTFDFLRNQINRGQRFVSPMFRNHIIAGNFISNENPELIMSAFGAGFFNVHHRSERVWRMLASPANLSHNRASKLLRQFEAEAAD